MANKKIIILIALFLFPSISFAAYKSQCQTGGEGGAQTGCTNVNDQKILTEQCQSQYDSSSCQNMSSYLNAMTVDCNKSNPSDVDCSTISQNGIYGREASNFAALQESGETNSSSKVASASSNATGWNMNTITGLGLPKGSLSAIILNVVYWLLAMLGFIGVIGFVISGIMYLISAGNDTMVTKAKRAMTYSLIGIIVGLAGVVIIQAIFNALNASTTI